MFAESLASFARNGSGNLIDGVQETTEEAFEDLVTKFPNDVACESRECVADAVGKSHRSQLAPNIEL